LLILEDGLTQGSQTQIAPWATWALTR